MVTLLSPAKKCTMQPDRRVRNRDGISGTNPDNRDRLVFLPDGCPFNVIEEMGMMVKIAVREINTHAIVTVFVKYHTVWNFSAPREGM